MTNDRIEKTILNNLVYNENYTRKVLPFIKVDYFKLRIEKIIFEEIEKFVNKYDNVTNTESLLIEVNNRKDINQEEYTNLKDLVSTFAEEKIDFDW